MPELLKLNLGSGMRPISGFVNVDKFGTPDISFDLETFPWPWATNSVGEIIMNHVMEHLGETTACFLKIMQEIYRVCVNGALIRIAVPHPRHSDFVTDPTHVRPITVECLQLFSKAHNRAAASQGLANSPLGLYIDVDFEIISSEMALDEHWSSMLGSGQMSEKEIREAERRFYNVVKDIRIVLRVVKPA